MAPAAPGTWPGRRAARRGLSVLLVALLCGAAQAAGSVSLPGTWYVLVHYKDDAASNPDEERWEDKVWVFEDQGRRLGWTEYPIVVFDDETGRFERRSTGQYARILHSWEPDAGQRADIADGLRVNTRGSKSKTLRGSDAQGWSSGRRQSAASASVITYEEVWSVEDLASLPVFTRRDYMGGGRTDSIEGAIRYTTTEIRDGGDLLVGTFERDGSRHGTFRMMRAGAIGSLEEKSQSEIQAQGFRRSLQTSQVARDQVKQTLEEVLQESGIPLRDPEIAEVSEFGVSLLAEGVPEAELRERLNQRVEALLVADLERPPAPVAVKGAVHDDSVRYRLPFGGAAPRKVSQGVGGDSYLGLMGTVGTNRFSHNGPFRYAFDFAMPIGTPVLAARAGTVVRVVDHYERGGRSKSLRGKANVVMVRHEDGTIAQYAHLSPHAAVAPGQRIDAGDLLGQSGSTGFSLGPHLHFDVQRLREDRRFETVPIRFDDGTAEGVVPVTGAYYGGK